MKAQRLGVDTGGTFTDAVRVDASGRWRISKLPTTAANPQQAILATVDALFPAVGEGVELIHGTTHATNALLTHNLGKVAFLTTQGFADLLAIGRQERDEVYALEPTVSRPLQPRRRVVEVGERLAADGKVLCNLGREEVQRVVRKVEQLSVDAVAVCLLHAFRNPIHERRLGKSLKSLGIPVVLSHEVAPEIREYERASTTWADAALIPVVRQALLALADSLQQQRPQSSLRMMRSDGGTAAVSAAVKHPVHLALSGPAGGLSAALSLATARGDRYLMTLDMGGTSTDVAWLDCSLVEQKPVSVGGLPLMARGLPIHSVGTGGGSLAEVDPGGQIQVGPQSAGAVPGPACYQRGGQHATLTDAHLHCGRLLPQAFLGGNFSLQPKLSAQVLHHLGEKVKAAADEVARQILQIAQADMERALRRVSLAEGHDPRESVLYAFGGAGALHAAWLADGLQMRGVVVPPCAGAFSALGLLGAPARRRLSQTMLRPLPKRRERRRLFASLVQSLKQELREEGLKEKELTVQCWLELRSRGQDGIFTLAEGPKAAHRFHQLQRQRFGFCRQDAEVELHAITVQVDGPQHAPWKKRRMRRQAAQAYGHGRAWFGTTGKMAKAYYFAREEMQPGSFLQGPAIVTEYSATTVVPPCWRAWVDAWDCLCLEPLR